jgi:hypothetical protein
MTVRLVDHAAFGALRLAPFLPRLRVVPPSARDPGAGRRFRGDVIVEVDGWEVHGRTWVGEVLGFTEILRREDDPEVTRSVAVELTGRHARAGVAVLDAIGLPLRRGHDRRAISRLLGRPVAVHSFVADRDTLEYDVGGRGRSYAVSCTVLKESGLTYVVVRRR